MDPCLSPPIYPLVLHFVILGKRCKWMSFRTVWNSNCCQFMLNLTLNLPKSVRLNCSFSKLLGADWRTPAFFSPALPGLIPKSTTEWPSLLHLTGYMYLLRNLGPFLLPRGFFSFHPRDNQAAVLNENKSPDVFYNL